MKPHYVEMTEIEREIYRKEMEVAIRRSDILPNVVNFRLENGDVISIEHDENKLIVTSERGHLAVLPQFANQVVVLFASADKPK